MRMFKSCFVTCFLYAVWRERVMSKCTRNENVRVVHTVCNDDGKKALVKRER